MLQLQPRVCAALHCEVATAAVEPPQRWALLAAFLLILVFLQAKAIHDLRQEVHALWQERAQRAEALVHHLVNDSTSARRDENNTLKTIDEATSMDASPSAVIDLYTVRTGLFEPRRLLSVEEGLRTPSASEYTPFVGSTRPDREDGASRTSDVDVDLDDDADTWSQDTPSVANSTHASLTRRATPHETTPLVASTCLDVSSPDHDGENNTSMDFATWLATTRGFHAEYLEAGHRQSKASKAE